MSVNVYFEQKGDHRQISLLIFLEFRFIFSVATRPLIFDILREVITKILKLVIFCQMKMLDSIHTRRFIFFFSPRGRAVSPTSRRLHLRRTHKALNKTSFRTKMRRFDELSRFIIIDFHLIPS